MDGVSGNIFKWSIFLILLALTIHFLLNHGGFIFSATENAMKTIKGPNGELIDCVDIYKQPAFDHPLLMNHKIQMKPSLNLSDVHEKLSVNEALQSWQVNGKCPKGTIPIRRAKKVDILLAASHKSLVKKYSNYRLAQEKADPATTSNGHEHVYAVQGGSRYYGANAVINLWRPKVRPNDLSRSQIWIMSNDHVENTVEAGLMVFPTLFGDHENQLIVYWTADSYNSTGCYNLLCPGFVQTSEDIALGTTFTPISTYGEDQYAITITIIKDKSSGNWWLSVGGSWVGYWPNALVPKLQDGAALVEWGGEVYNSDFKNGSTTTQMGSGHFASEGFKKAAFFASLWTVDADGQSHNASNLVAGSEKPECYDVITTGSSFYYGGPGKSSKCT